MFRLSIILCASEIVRDFNRTRHLMVLNIPDAIKQDIALYVQLGKEVEKMFKEKNQTTGNNSLKNKQMSKSINNADSKENNLTVSLSNPKFYAYNNGNLKDLKQISFDISKLRSLRKKISQTTRVGANITNPVFSGDLELCSSMDNCTFLINDITSSKIRLYVINRKLEKVINEEIKYSSKKFKSYKENSYLIKKRNKIWDEVIKTLNEFFCDIRSIEFQIKKNPIQLRPIQMRRRIRKNK